MDLSNNTKGTLTHRQVMSESMYARQEGYCSHVKISVGVLTPKLEVYRTNRYIFKAIQLLQDTNIYVPFCYFMSPIFSKKA